MSDEIKHECAVALLRLLDGDGEPARSGPLAVASDPGGAILSLLLEKQHNRGQDGAGAAALLLDPAPGEPACWVSKSASPTALADVLGAIRKRMAISHRGTETQRDAETDTTLCAPVPPCEKIFLGHLRYATFGKGDESFCHPFVHAEPRLDRTLLLAGNFNLTNTHELFEEFWKSGNHPANSADGYLICELLACALADADDHTTPSPVSDAIASRRNSGRSPVRPATAASRPGGTGLRQDSASAETPLRIAAKRRTMPEAFPPDGVAEQSRFCDPAPTILRALRAVLPTLDGAFTLCGMTGDGWAFAVRDARGIRPGWFLESPRAVAVASERPAIQAAFDVPPEAVRELPPGVALLVSPAGDVSFERVLAPAVPRPCAFERIYFSRANDAAIHRERKALGAALLPQILKSADADISDVFFSYIPNSAQIAFHGLLEELFRRQGPPAQRPHGPRNGIEREDVVPRFGQIAVKDAKFRTFIADAHSREEFYKHIYDVTYGLLRPGKDTLVVLDDSIVRGNTMKNAILPMLDRLGPRRIVVASSAPPIRYPDCYGIDMSTLGELVAFRALVNLLGDAADAELHAALETMCHAEKEESLPPADNAGDAENVGVNPLAVLYARFSDEEHCAEIARLLTPAGMKAEVKVVFQSVANMRRCLQPSTFQPSNFSPFQPFNLSTVSDGGLSAIGDWYFTGEYPTPGGYRVLRTALANYLSCSADRSY